MFWASGFWASGFWAENFWLGMTVGGGDWDDTGRRGRRRPRTTEDTGT